MAQVVEHRKFSLTNLGNNNNKYWNITLYDNGDVMSEWARQGDPAQSKTWSGAGKSFVESKIREKEKKGYIENKVVEGTGEIKVSSSVSNTELKTIALKQIKAKNPIVQQLIDFLVKVNAHNILQATQGKIKYDTSSASFKTTQGVVMPEQVSRARDLLVDLAKNIAKNNFGGYDFEDKLNEYLSLIPRDFGRKRLAPKDILPDLKTVQKENDILDGLDASFAGLQTVKSDKTKKEQIDTPKIFDVEMELIEDKNIINKINAYYQRTKKTMHQSYHYKLKKVYRVNIANNVEAFEKNGKQIGNIMELFHGTKCSSCLSILKQGLIIPPSSASHCTGRLYGDGIYASDISSKALNYATNYWTGGGSTDRIFMFLCDFAMGKIFYPDGKYGISYPYKGYDSTFAKAGKSGVYNNEMIVYKTYQVKLKYLLEFE